MIPMWLVGVVIGVVGAAAIAAVIWALPVTLRRLKRKRAKREPKTRELVTRLGVDMSPMVEAIRKAGEVMRKIQQAPRHAHCRSVMVPEPAGPPDILCSSCGDTLERNGDHFDCTGCGRQVRP